MISLPSPEPWAEMWLIAAMIFVVAKSVSWFGRGPTRGVSFGRSFAYLVMWPGLDARAFLVGRDARRPGWREWAFALLQFGFGLSLTFGLVRAVPADQQLLVGWIGAVGLIFLLHFGSFHLISCFWRSFDVDAKPIMSWPIAARSVSEFWGQRWNLAFRDLSARFIFRPVARRWSVGCGTLAVFVFSGLVHDLVISVPARAGYGLPTLYFLIQAAAVFVERSKPGRRIGLGRGWRGRVFAIVIVGAPVGFLLFHPPCVTRVLAPFVTTLNSLF